MKSCCVLKKEGRDERCDCVDGDRVEQGRPAEGVDGEGRKTLDWGEKRGDV
jgi:hypothetical protein